jgi:hypothetical protein
MLQQVAPLKPDGVIGETMVMEGKLTFKHLLRYVTRAGLAVQLPRDDHFVAQGCSWHAIARVVSACLMPTLPA